MPVEPRAKVFHCPGNNHALTIGGVVAALGICQEATGVSDGAMIAISILQG